MQGSVCFHMHARLFSYVVMCVCSRMQVCCFHTQERFFFHIHEAFVFRMQVCCIFTCMDSCCLMIVRFVSYAGALLCYA